MRYRLIVLDLDGTILDSRGEMSPKLRRTIMAVKTAGIQVTLATGRRVVRTLPWAKDLNITLPIISHNGAVVIEPNQQKVCYWQGIPLKTANQLINELSLRQMPYLVYSGQDYGDTGYLPEQYHSKKMHLLTYVDDQITITKKIGLVSDPIKISVLDESSKTDVLLSSLGRYKDHINMIVYRSEKYTGIDFLRKGCSKASGVRYIAEKQKINMAQVLAIGDDYNDLEMIKEAGLGVAMANAPTQVRQAADYVALSNDQDGAADILQKFCL